MQIFLCNAFNLFLVLEVLVGADLDCLRNAG